MAQSPCKMLSPLQYRGLQKLGDVFCPGDGEFPCFSVLGCAEHSDRLLEYMPDKDREDLKVLLMLMAILPSFAIRGLLVILEFTVNFPGPLGAVLRLMRIGMKGLAASLYYSGYVGSSYRGKSPVELLGYNVSVYTADLDNGTSNGKRGPQATA